MQLPVDLIWWQTTLQTPHHMSEWNEKCIYSPHMHHQKDNSMAPTRSFTMPYLIKIVINRNTISPHLCVISFLIDNHLVRSSTFLRILKSVDFFLLQEMRNYNQQSMTINIIHYMSAITYHIIKLKSTCHTLQTVSTPMALIVISYRNI